MKRVITVIVVVAIACACCFVGCSRSSDLASTFVEKASSAFEKAKDLLPGSDSAESQSFGEDAGDVQAEGEIDEAGNRADGESGEFSFPSLGDISLGAGEFSSADDVALVPTDDYGQYYVFDYGGEQFTAFFDSVSWKVYDSYKISNHGDIVKICQALLNEHPVLGSDWESMRTADDMAFEWEQHNIAYNLLPEDSHWRDDAKDVDLDPDDQGKSFQEIYESRTGREFDVRNYLPLD